MGLKDTLGIYATYLANLISQGDLTPNSKMHSMSVKSTFDRVVTRTRIKKVWCVQNIPIENPYTLVELIRDRMSILEPKCKTIVNMVVYPKEIDINHEKFRRGLRYSSKEYNRYESIFQTLESHEKTLGKKIKEGGGRYVTLDERFIENLRAKKESYEYVHSHKTSGGEFGIVYIFIEGISKDKKSMNNYRNRLNGLLQSLNLKGVEMFGNINAYISNFSPIAYMEDEKVNDVNGMLMSDENIVGILPYGQEGVLGESGAYWGMIRGTRMPLMVNLTEGTTAQNIGVCGKSGHGKTVVTINALNSHIALGHYINVMDYKGGEYTPLANIASAKEISMKEHDSVFTNTMRLDGLEFLPDDMRKSLYGHCVKATIDLLSLMVNLKPSEGSEEDLEVLLHEAVKRVYKDVSRDLLYTHENTKNLKYSDLLEALKSLTGMNSLGNGQKELLNLAINRVSVYLEENGYKSHMFKKEITLKDIMSAQVVIYNFGKNEDYSEFTVEDSIRIFMMGFLNTRKKMYAKSLHGYTVNVYEELQRATNNPKIIRAINHDSTGGRSDNLITYLIFNSVGIFDSDNKDIQAIRSNFTSYIIGYLEENDLKILNKYFNLKDIEAYVQLIADDQRNYNRHFAVKYDTGVTRNTALVKVELPEEIMESDLFKTRDTESV